MPNRGILEESRAGEMMPSADSRAAIVSVDAERLGGTACFVGTRVPIKYLWEYLIDGKSLETFLEDFEGVPREAAVAALRESYDRFTEGLPEL